VGVCGVWCVVGVGVCGVCVVCGGVGLGLIHPFFLCLFSRKKGGCSLFHKPLKFCLLFCCVLRADDYAYAILIISNNLKMFL
jgi:hypothetical protein